LNRDGERVMDEGKKEEESVKEREGLVMERF
jgi:hypothetical protein